MLFKNSVRTSKRTPHFTITKINCLTLFKEIIDVYSVKHKKALITTLLTVETGGTHSYHRPLKD